MQPFRAGLKLVWGLALAGVVAGLASYAAMEWWRTSSTVPVANLALHDGDLSDWKTIGGNWAIRNGVMVNESVERGAKIVAGSQYWRDYTFSSEIQFRENNADMGLAVRVENEKKGVDTYDGYYVGLRTLDGSMVIGRSHFGWAEAAPVPVPGGIHSGIWYRLEVTAVGCSIAASVENLKTAERAWMAVKDPSCVRSGKVALRSLNAGAMWRNISVRPATWQDYLELERKAPLVEEPEFPPARPWWTPLHTGLALAGIFFIASLAQLLYFQLLRWKTSLITAERERLALEIHDTMAQSFAGIGYQIQGIRSSVLRPGQIDTAHIAEQLDTAYLLVRNCHMEASRTIAMLSSFAPAIEDLGSALVETAEKIAGTKIRIVKAVSGTPFPLSLRMADALLHIGQEAIANAAHHASPSELYVRLRYEVNQVQLEIEDNGCGFLYRADSAGLGLLGMQRRAHDIAGRLEIESSPRAGTRVCVSVKVEHPGFLERTKKLFAERQAKAEKSRR